MQSSKMESGQKLFRENKDHLLERSKYGQPSRKYRFERPTWRSPAENGMPCQLYVQVVSTTQLKGFSRPRWVLARYKDSYWDTSAPIDDLEVIEHCDHYLDPQLLNNRFDFMEDSQKGEKSLCACLCLVGPVRAQIPNFTQMAEQGPQALVDIQNFRIPSNSSGYSECEQDVFMLAGYDDVNKRLVELTELTAYPAASLLSRRSSPGYKAGQKVPFFQDGKYIKASTDPHASSLRPAPVPVNPHLGLQMPARGPHTSRAWTTLTSSSSLRRNSIDLHGVMNVGSHDERDDDFLLGAEPQGKRGYPGDPHGKRGVKKVVHDSLKGLGSRVPVRNRFFGLPWKKP